MKPPNKRESATHFILKKKDMIQAREQNNCVSSHHILILHYKFKKTLSKYIHYIFPSEICSPNLVIKNQTIVLVFI